MNVYLKKVNKTYNFKFLIDSENYIFKNNLTDFLTYGFDIKKIFLKKNISVEFLKNFANNTNNSLYLRAFAICITNIIEEQKGSISEEKLSNYVIDFFEFHGIMFDLCFNGIQLNKNNMCLFEQYFELSKIDYDNIFLKNISVFNPFNYIIEKKEKIFPVNFSSISALCFYELQEMLNINKKPKICNICKKAFISVDSKKEYCNRLYKNGKTCFETANTKEFRNFKFNEKTEKDEYLAEYMKAYRKVFKNKYKNPNCELTDNDRTKLKNLKEYLNRVRLGAISKDEYINLLKNINK